MITWLNHVAIAVPDLAKAAAQYELLGARISEPQDLPDHGVTVVFVTLPNAKLELLCPLGEASPITSFLERNPAGGIHHLCFEVENLEVASQTLMNVNARILGDGTPKAGAHGKPVIFVHPKDFQGVLVEFEET
jgi:methylmalonyl-CoA/ethylmalonyl-CoA epimerase